MTESPFRILRARSAADLADAVHLFVAYAASLDIDLGYQNFDEELRTLPGAYGPPGGALLLARDPIGKAVGCVAMRPIRPYGCCEMKRLYVAPKMRGAGLGRMLIGSVVEEATRIGYRDMRLDTLPTMTTALALYAECGFKPIAPYYDTPVTGSVFLGRPLAPTGPGAARVGEP